MVERTIAMLVAAVIAGVIIGRVSARRGDERIVWSEPIDPATADADVKSLVLQGEYIQAIKRYRELSGVGLKEAKDYVDALKAHLRTHPPS